MKDLEIDGSAGRTTEAQVEPAHKLRVDADPIGNQPSLRKGGADLESRKLRAQKPGQDDPGTAAAETVTAGPTRSG